MDINKWLNNHNNKMREKGRLVDTALQKITNNVFGYAFQELDLNFSPLEPKLNLVIHFQWTGNGNGKRVTWQERKMADTTISKQVIG